MASTISFSGLSASGLDTSSWVDALVSVKQQTVTSLEQQKAEKENLLSIVNNIKSYFSSFQTCLQKITDSQYGIGSMDLFMQNLALSSNSNIATATATTEAARQSYDVAVDSLATATKATSGYSQIEIKTADLNTTFGTLGGKNGTITVNSQSFNVTTEDTLQDLINKFKNVGVDAKFDENKGTFTIGMDLDKIDEGATNLKNALKLANNNVSGAVSGSVVYANRNTEFYKLGLKGGDINIAGVKHTVVKNGNNYTIRKNGGTAVQMNTLGEFLDYLKSSAVGADDATVDTKGHITIKGATLDKVEGGTNLMDVLNLIESQKRTVSESGALSYIEVRVADLNTKLSALGITGDTTLVAGGANNTISNDKTLGDIKNILKNAGVDMSVDSRGIITIDTHGNEISGTLLDVLNLDPTKGGTTISSSAHQATLKADGNTKLSELGIGDDKKYTAYKSDGTALTAEISNVANKTINELVTALKNVGLDAKFDEKTHQITIKDGYIEGSLADALGMTQLSTSFTENATLNTKLEKLGATGDSTLTIDGGTAKTYGKDTTLETVFNDIKDAGGKVTFKDGNVTIEGVTLGGSIPSLLGLDATTQGTSVTSGKLTAVTGSTSSGGNTESTVEHNIELSTKLGDITGTDSNYTLKVGDGTSTTYTKDSTLQDIKTQIEGAGGKFTINDDNTISVDGVTMSGTVVGALGFDELATGTKFTTVNAVMISGTSNVATGDTTLGNLGLVASGATSGARAVRRAPATNPNKTLSINGGTAKTYGADVTLDDIFADIVAAGGTASIDSEGYIVIDGVHLEGTLVDALGLVETSYKTTITSGDLKVTTSTKSTSSSTLYTDTKGDIAWDSTIGSIVGDTNSYDLKVNGANKTYNTNTKLSDIKNVIQAAGGTMTINDDNTISINGVEISGSLVDKLGFVADGVHTVVSSNNPIYYTDGKKSADTGTTFEQLGVDSSKRDYAIYKNDGTVVKASSTNGTDSGKTIGDWLKVVNDSLNTANGTSGITYASINNGVISITGGYVAGSLPTELGIGTKETVTGITMEGSSVTYVEYDPLKYIGNVQTGSGIAAGNVSCKGFLAESLEYQDEFGNIQTVTETTKLSEVLDSSGNKIGSGSYTFNVGSYTKTFDADSTTLGDIINYVNNLNSDTTYDTTTSASLVDGKLSIESNVDITGTLMDKLGFEKHEISSVAYEVKGTGKAQYKVYVSSVSDFTSGSTYYLKSASDLNKLAELTNAGKSTSDVTFILENDIDLSGQQFVPIGTNNHHFYGKFYGNGHVIKNLTITDTSVLSDPCHGIISHSDGTSSTTYSYYAGLFGTVESAELHDIWLENVNIDTSIDGYDSVYAGALVGWSYKSNFDNCYSTGSVTADNNSGGLVGYALHSSVSNSHSTANVQQVHDSSMSYGTGGLIGECYKTSISNSYVTGNITGYANLGGLVGRLSSDSSISNSYVTGNVTGYTFLGGLVGNSSGSISNSYATGNVTGDYSRGCLVGTNFSSTVTNCGYISSTGLDAGVSSGATAMTDAQIKSAINGLGLGTNSATVVNNTVTVTATTSTKISDLMGKGGNQTLTLTPTAGGDAKVLTFNETDTIQTIIDKLKAEGIDEADLVDGIFNVKDDKQWTISGALANKLFGGDDNLYSYTGTKVTYTTTSTGVAGSQTGNQLTYDTTTISKTGQDLVSYTKENGTSYITKKYEGAKVTYGGTTAGAYSGTTKIFSIDSTLVGEKIIIYNQEKMNSDRNNFMAGGSSGSSGGASSSITDKFDQTNMGKVAELEITQFTTINDIVSFLNNQTSYITGASYNEFTGKLTVNKKYGNSVSIPTFSYEGESGYNGGDVTYQIPLKTSSPPTIANETTKMSDLAPAGGFMLLLNLKVTNNGSTYTMGLSENTTFQNILDFFNNTAGCTATLTNGVFSVTGREDFTMTETSGYGASETKCYLPLIFGGSVPTAITGTGHSDEGYTFKESVATGSSTLASLRTSTISGYSSDITANGNKKTLSGISTSSTIDEVLTAMSSAFSEYGLTGSISGGKVTLTSTKEVTLSGDIIKDFFGSDSISLTASGSGGSSTTHTATGSTKMSDLGITDFKVNGSTLGGISATSTVDDVLTKLKSTYGLSEATISDGKITLKSDTDVTLSGNLIKSLMGQDSITITATAGGLVTNTADTTTTVGQLFGDTNDKSIKISAPDGTEKTLTFASTDSIQKVMDTLKSNGFTSVTFADGKLTLKSNTQYTLSGMLAEKLLGDAQTVFGTTSNMITYKETTGSTGTVGVTVTSHITKMACGDASTTLDTLGFKGDTIKIKNASGAVVASKYFCSSDTVQDLMDFFNANGIVSTLENNSYDLKFSSSTTNYAVSTDPKFAKELGIYATNVCLSEAGVVIGGGTYYLSSAEDIKVFSNLETSRNNDNKYTFILTNDIDMSGVTGLGKGFYSDDTYCPDVFIYGNGHVIKNYSASEGCLLDGGCHIYMYDLGMENTSNAMIDRVSGGEIINCYTTGNIDNSKGFLSRGIGGFANEIFNATVKNCYSTCNVKGDAEKTGNVGGFVGYVVNSEISDCYATGTVTGTDYRGNFGGFAGVSMSTNYTKCFSTGNVFATGITELSAINSGGFVGTVSKYRNEDGNSIFDSCYSTSVVSSTKDHYRLLFGGFAGSLEDATVKNCYSTDNRAFVYEAKQATISDSLSFGSSFIGGLSFLGEQSCLNCSITNCQYNGSGTESSGATAASGLTAPFAYSTVTGFKTGVTNSQSVSGTPSCISFDTLKYETDVTNTDKISSSIAYRVPFDDPIDVVQDGVEKRIDVSLSDTFGDLIAKFADVGITASLVDGIFKIEGGSNYVTHIYTNLEMVLGLSGPYYSDGSSTTIKDMTATTTIGQLFEDSSSHTITVDGETITLAASDTITNLISKLAEKGISGKVENSKLILTSSASHTLSGDIVTKLFGTSSQSMTSSSGSVASSPEYTLEKISGGADVYNMEKTSGSKLQYTSRELTSYSATERVSEVSELVAGNKYHISTAEDLVALANFVKNGTDTTGSIFIFDNDIDMSGVTGFEGIGTLENAFKGTVYGNGHVVKNMTIDSTSTHVGLFGYIEQATIQDLAITDANVKGSDWAGILLGYAKNSQISNIYTTGTVNSTGAQVGGLAGELQDSNATNVYSTATVSGRLNVGGLIGTLSGSSVEKAYAMGNVASIDGQAGGLIGALRVGGSIKNAYSTGDVQGAKSVGGFIGLAEKSDISYSLDTVYSTGRANGTTNVGGFIGDIRPDATVNVANAVFNRKISTSAIGYGSATGNISGKDYEQMIQKSVMQNAGFTEDKGWVYVDNYTPTFGNIAVTGGGKTYLDNTITSLTSGSAYYISTIEQLNNLATLVNNGVDTTGVSFILENDIDVSSFTNTIGNASGTNSFKGLFYGNGNSLTGLKTNLFGKIDGDAVIRDLALENMNGSGHLASSVAGNSTIDNVYSTGSTTVSGLVNKLGGSATIKNSYSTATVNSSSASAGGLVAQMEGSATIEKSFATGNVKASTSAGGLVGSMSGGTVKSSYATGNVTGGSYRGGLIGQVTGSVTIQNSYASGTATGGFIGKNSGTVTSSGNVYNSANAKAVGSGSSVSGLTALSLADMKSQTKMEGLGFTADKGWYYYADKTPMLQGKDISSVGSEHQINTKSTLDSICKNNVDKTINVTINGVAHTNTFNGSDTVGDVVNWLNTIDGVNASLSGNKFQVSGASEDFKFEGDLANILLGDDKVVTKQTITENTDSNGLVADGAKKKIDENTTVGQLLGKTSGDYSITYKDDDGNIKSQTFSYDKKLSDVLGFLNNNGFQASIVNGVFTATKDGKRATDISGSIGEKLKGENGTITTTSAGYKTGELSSASSSKATATTKLSDLGIASGSIFIKDNNNNTLGTIQIDNSMTIDDTAQLLANYGFTLGITDGKVTIEGNGTNRIADGTSNLVSQMKLNNWIETKDKLKTDSTVAQMGFGKGSTLGLVIDSKTYNLTFDANATLQDIIDTLGAYGVTASVDNNGKFTASASGNLILTNELGAYLTKNSVEGYVKEADGYKSKDPIEFKGDKVKLDYDSKVGDILGNGKDGVLRLTLNEDTVVDLTYKADDTMADIIADLKGYGITATINDGVLKATSNDKTFRFSGEIGKIISGDTPQYEDISTGYISKDLAYKTTNKTNMNNTLKEMGVSSGQIHVLSNDGKIVSTLDVDENYTVAQVKSLLQPFGMTLSVDENGKFTVASAEGYKLSDGTSNMVSKMGLNNWTTSTEKLSGATTLAQMGFKDGADLNLFLDGAVMNVLSFDANQTVEDIIFGLAAYGIEASVNADGQFTATSKSHTFIMSGGLGSYLTKGTGGYVNSDTGYESYKPLVEEHAYVETASKELEHKKLMTEGSTLESLGFAQGGTVRVMLDGKTPYTLQFLATDKVQDVIYALSAYGINAEVKNGRFVAESVNNTFTLTGNLGSYLVQGGVYQNEVTGYESKPLTYETTEKLTNDTKLSDLGITRGDINVIKDGKVADTIHISDDTTIGQLFSAITPYGMTGEIVTKANGDTSIRISADSDIKLADGTSNVVSGLGLQNVRKGDFEGTKKYWDDDATSGLITEDTLLSTLDRNGFIAQGSLIFNTGEGDDAIQHIINISANETVGSLLKKFNDSGIKATLDDGVIKLTGGLDKLTFTGGTSGLVETIGLDIHNIDKYASSTSALTYEGETHYSASNFANANTKLDIVNTTDGNMSIFVDGIKCNIEVKSSDSFADLFKKIKNTVKARTGMDIQAGFKTKDGSISANPTDANNTGIIGLEIEKGHELVVGASNDTTNFATIANLNKTDYNAVTGSRALYRVNVNSLITESGLYRDGDITEGTFKIGDAEFTIDSTTTLASLINQINKNDKAYASAYWDTLAGTLVIESTVTGASLINIEAGTSNFTDIMGFTKTKDGVSALITDSQTLGQNAVVRINGTTVTSATNVITSDISKIKGLTINLKNVSAGETVTITVEQDKESIYNAVSDTLDAYNSMMEALNKELADRNSLGGESILKLMRNNLKRLMTSSLTGAYVFKNLAAVGISTGEASDKITTNVTSLLIDKDKFIDALTTDSDAVQDLLVGTKANPGIFLQANNIVESSINTDGYFSNMANNLTKSISNIEKKISKNNLAIENYRTKLETKFHNMELTISGLQSAYANILK